MPRSMTGYGLATGAANGGKVQVEIRTVNHRNFTANLKLASPLHSLESDVRKALHEQINRGHVTASARWLEEPERPTVSKVNLTRAREVTEALRELKAELDLPGEIDLSFVVRQPDVFTVQLLSRLSFMFLWPWTMASDPVSGSMILNPPCPIAK